MKKQIVLALFASAMFGLTACGGSKSAAQQGDVEINMPCFGEEYSTNSEYIRASAVGISTDMMTAKKKALSSARTEIATSIQTKLQAVVDDYTSDYQVGENDDAKRRFQEMARSTVKQNLSGLRTICEKMMKTPEGKYKAYVTVELAGNEILENVKKGAEGIGSDEKMRIDFEYEKFKKVFEEEMSKMK